MDSDGGAAQLYVMLTLGVAMLYDAFICHAFEDKESFVRPLAQALRRANIEIWYDEFSLKAGDSLRRSIDRGLSKSRYGIVVLSQAFFAKKWPQWELDGLLQKQNASDYNVILPVWLGISHKEVFEVSPSLADKVATNADLGIDTTVNRLLEVIKPQGSSLVDAREILINMKYEPPVVSDDWWHGVIEYCGSNPMEDTFQEAMGWGRWGFPLPPKGETTTEKGTRIAWAALQLHWQGEADRRRISQLSEPDLVHEFIRTIPGLLDACSAHLNYLAVYAPQLLIPGFGGSFEPAFDVWLHDSNRKQLRESKKGSRSGTALTTDGEVPTCDELISLHDPEFGHYKPSHVANRWVDGTMWGPPTRAYDLIDYSVWLISRASAWLPEPSHGCLLAGMKEWAMWSWSPSSNDTTFAPLPCTGAFQNALFRYKSSATFRMTGSVMDDLRTRIEHSKKELSLPEAVADLVDGFLSEGFVASWYESNLRRKKKTKPGEHNKSLE